MPAPPAFLLLGSPHWGVDPCGAFQGGQPVNRSCERPQYAMPAEPGHPPRRPHSSPNVRATRASPRARPAPHAPVLPAHNTPERPLRCGAEERWVFLRLQPRPRRRVPMAPVRWGGLARRQLYRSRKAASVPGPPTLPAPAPAAVLIRCPQIDGYEHPSRGAPNPRKRQANDLRGGSWLSGAYLPIVPASSRRCQRVVMGTPP